MVEEGDQQDMGEAQCETKVQMWSRYDHNCNFMLPSCLVGPLPQPFLPTLRSLLYVVWASLGYVFQFSGQLCILWMVCNLPESEFLHCLDPYPSPSSSRLSPYVMAANNSFMRSILELICLCALTGSSSKSSCQPCLPCLSYSFADPFMLQSGAYTVSPISVDV